MKVVTFGEILLRLSPEGHKRFLQAEGYIAEAEHSTLTLTRRGAQLLMNRDNNFGQDLRLDHQSYSLQMG